MQHKNLPLRRDSMKKYIILPICIIINLIFSTSAYAEYFEITSSAAVEFLKSPLPNMVFLDVRTAREYEQGHIQGARLLDIYRFEFEEELKKLDRSAPYVVYCLAGIRSQKAFNKMKKLGFSNIFIMPSGIYDWKDKGLPLVTGPSARGD